MRTRPLGEASPREMRPLLDEEAAFWQSELGWDFGEVRAAVAASVGRGVFHHPIQEMRQIEKLRIIEPEEDLSFMMEAIRLVRKELEGRSP